MYKVIVFTHGELGKGLLNSARMVSGPVDDVDSFSILPGIDTDEVLAEVERSVNQSEEAGVPVLLFTDLFFGTPFNLLVGLSQRAKFTHITGVNLPMLIEALSYRREADTDLQSLIPGFLEVGKNGIVNCSELAQG